MAALTAFRASRLYPFVVITRLNRDYALQQWNTEAKTLIGVLAPTLLRAIVLLATAFYRRQMEVVTRRGGQAERLVRVNATVFDASSESIVITDASANIISVNAAFTPLSRGTPRLRRWVATRVCWLQGCMTSLSTQKCGRSWWQPAIGVAK